MPLGLEADCKALRSAGVRYRCADLCSRVSAQALRRLSMFACLPIFVLCAINLGSAFTNNRVGVKSRLAVSWIMSNLNPALLWSSRCVTVTIPGKAQHISDRMCSHHTVDDICRMSDHILGASWRSEPLARSLQAECARPPGSISQTVALNDAIQLHFTHRIQSLTLATQSNAAIA